MSSSKFDKILGCSSGFRYLVTSDSKADFSGKGDSGEVTGDLTNQRKTENFIKGRWCWNIQPRISESVVKAVN